VRTIVLVLCSAVNIPMPAADLTVYRVGIGVLRQQVSEAVLPEYPLSSLSAGHAGRDVVDVWVSDSGKVLRVNTLEAPDRAISLAVEFAVRRWTFRAFLGTRNEGPFSVRSRLIFYFNLVDGKPTVVDAAAAAIAMRRKAP
jgi:hypothetical protein